jgi:hypothetical protein
MKFPMTNLAGICTAAALVLMLGSNLVDIGRVHDALLKARGQQQVNLEVSKRAETQLDALAKGTKALADAGNPNARDPGRVEAERHPGERRGRASRALRLPRGNITIPGFPSAGVGFRTDRCSDEMSAMRARSSHWAAAANLPHEFMMGGEQCREGGIEGLPDRLKANA